MTDRSFFNSIACIGSRIAENETSIRDAQRRIEWYRMLSALVGRLNDGWRRTEPPTQDDPHAFFLTDVHFGEPLSDDEGRKIMKASAVWVREHLDDAAAAEAHGAPIGVFADVAKSFCTNCGRHVPVIGRCFHEDGTDGPWVLQAHAICMGCPRVMRIGEYRGTPLISSRNAVESASTTAT